MENLLKVKSIVSNIANCLRPEDYVRFKTVNKQVYYEHLDEEFEQEYFSLRLTLMGLIVTVEKNNGTYALIDSNDLKTLTPVNTFNKLTSCDIHNAKNCFIQVYKVFSIYCDKLYNNSLTNFFPPPFDTDPVVQSEILSNIKKFNKCNIIDPSYYQETVTNFNILKELFVNSCLNEMENNFNAHNYDVVGKFIRILLQTDEQNISIDFFNSKIEYPKLTVNDIQLTVENIPKIWAPLKQHLKETIEMIDIFFEDKYSMVPIFYENFVQQTILEGINELLELSDSNQNNDTEFLTFFPSVYFECVKACCIELPDSINGSMNLPKGKTYQQSLNELLNIYLEPYVVRYLNLSTGQFEKDLERQFKNFKIEQENKIETDLLNMTTKEQTDSEDQSMESLKKNDSENKINFLESFTKVFRITNTKKEDNEEKLNDNLINLMNTNLQNIKKLINLELCYNIVQQAHNKVDTILSFQCIPQLGPLINAKCEEIFKILITVMNRNHVTPAFEKAIDLLDEYDITDQNTFDTENIEQSVKPLINFAELINIGDIILQMISIFFNNVMVKKQIIDNKNSNKKNIWQNQVLQTKKNFETTLDNFVADGLNIGINKLLEQIKLVFNTSQLPTDYYPPPNDPPRDTIPTKCAKMIIEILSNHCFLLTGATDKGTIDVYQQEIGRRFFIVLVEHIKRQIISTKGAIQLICDVNYYYDFINNRLKQKNVVPYFQGLKNICSLYLIDSKDSKELGKLICDLGKFQGIFTQEEIYEFVQRRQDWIAVKREVQKVMYGFGVKDCVIM
ncbi:Rcy1p PWA37_004590 [Arxiozyma heterogenica]|uniref:Rcy1p n=1 Tax=Arxiozyma heterogenica TaxID=278026 RepID=UPI002F013217